MSNQTIIPALTAAKQQANHDAEDDTETRGDTHGLPGILVHVFIGRTCSRLGLFHHRVFRTAQPRLDGIQIFVHPALVWVMAAGLGID